jgi:AraC-like DNA-binding protein
VKQLASELGVSYRRTSRAFGLTVKKFARLSRLETIIAGRNVGLAWAEIAYEAKISDQDHLVEEFKNVVLETPEQFFGHDRVPVPDMGAMTGREFIAQRRRGKSATSSAIRIFFASSVAAGCEIRPSQSTKSQYRMGW